MKKNWLTYLVAVAAIMIAGSAAFFSVTGLGVLFSGAAVAVMIMAGSLEFAKLVTATYLKQEWNTIKGLNKWYLTSAVVILMLITSAGIFGYLSNAFQQQNIKLEQVQREIQVWQNKIDFNEKQKIDLKEEQNRQSKTQDKFLEKGNLNNSRITKSLDKRDIESKKLTDKIGILNDSIVAFNGHINDIKNNNIGIEREVGGFRFVAEAFGVELKTVVKFFIFLIVVVFDPLAVALIISFNQLVMVKRKEEDEIPKPNELKEFVDEATRIHLSENDLKILEETLLNPPKPNDALKDAAKEYKNIFEKPEREPYGEMMDIIDNNRINIIEQNNNEELHNEEEIIHPIVDEKPPHILEKEREQFHYWDIKSPQPIIDDVLTETQNETFSQEPTSLNLDEKKK